MSLSNSELLPIRTSTFLGHNGVTPTESLGLTSIAPSSEPKTCDSEYSCLNCTTARICAPFAGGQSFEEIEVIGCHSSTPCCDSDTGTCSADKTLACSESSSATSLACETNTSPTLCRRCSVHVSVSRKETSLRSSLPSLQVPLEQGSLCQLELTLC